MFPDTFEVGIYYSTTDGEEKAVTDMDKGYLVNAFAKMHRFKAQKIGNEAFQEVVDHNIKQLHEEILRRIKLSEE